MADQLEILKKLQAIDGELFQCRRQQQEKPEELEQIEAEVADQQSRLKAAEDRLKALQLSQKEKEGQLQTHEENVKKLQGQLFQLKTNKEYSAMQREIDSLKADNSLLEEAIIQLLDSVEQAKREQDQEQRRFTDEQERLRRERERIDRELGAIGERMAQLERSRTTLVPDVPPQTLKSYEQVLNIREGLAMVPLVDEACGGCYRKLTPQVINQVYLKSDLVMCENCNRILYSDEHQSTV